MGIYTDPASATGGRRGSDSRRPETENGELKNEHISTTQRREQRDNDPRQRYQGLHKGKLDRKTQRSNDR